MVCGEDILGLMGRGLRGISYLNIQSARKSPKKRKVVHQYFLIDNHLKVCKSFIQNLY